MPYCQNCGNSVGINDAFCQKCGSPINGLHKINEREVYQGYVIKCPSCGGELTGFSAICPHCGHELNCKKVSQSIRDFTLSLQYYDAAINAYIPTYAQKSGKRSPKVSPTFGCLVVILLTIPAALIISYGVYLLVEYFYIVLAIVIGLLFIYLRIKGQLNAVNPKEKEKASFINNYVFPNEREVMIEAQIFIKNQLTVISSEPLNKKTGFWLRTWKKKADDIHKKADLLIKNALPTT